MARLSMQYYFRHKAYEEESELQLSFLKKLELAEKMDEEERTRLYGKDCQLLFEEFKQELDALRKKQL